MDIPSFDGKKTNRMLFFLFLCITFAVLAVTSLLGIFKSGVELSAMLVLAVITGVMSCWYGIHWVYNIFRDRFMEKWFSEEEEAEGQEDGEEGKGQEPESGAAEEFVVPADLILDAVRNRCRRSALYILTAESVLWLAAAVILACTGVIGETSSLTRLLLYCVLISVPGIILYLLIRAGYMRSVPETVTLMPGKLAVGGEEYAAGDLESVRTVPEKRRGPADSFRLLELCTEDGRDRFRISFGTVPDPVREDYDRFTQALSAWCRDNGVTVSIDA